MLRHARAIIVRNFGIFSARTRWPVKKEKYSTMITEELYKSSQTRKTPIWANLDNPITLIAKEPYLDVLFGKVLQDIANRYQLMQSKCIKSYYGLNCYGLQVAESVFGGYQNLIKQDPSEIRTKCKEFALEAQDRYKSTYRKWGILFDPNSFYSTTDKEYEAAVVEGFSRLWEQRKSEVYKAF